MRRVPCESSTCSGFGSRKLSKVSWRRLFTVETNARHVLVKAHNTSYYNKQAPILKTILNRIVFPQKIGLSLNS